jgi:predicted TIM-barrel fold metal-dependent hydrolase
MRIIDTHQHLIHPDRFRYAWTRQTAALADKPFRLEEYRVAARGTGIAESLFMEVDVDEALMGEETRFFLELSGQPGSGIRGVIAACRPEREDFPAQLDAMLHPRLRGLRRILHTQPDELSQSRCFGDNLARLSRHGLTFDLCLLSRQLRLAATLLRQAPDVQFVLDHCGIPEIKQQTLDHWRERIRELAQFPNLACKISGVVAYCDPAHVTPQAVRPFVEHCIECFGWDRVLFGGDWPVCTLTSSLGRWVEIAREIVRDEPAERQAKLFAENAERIYRLKA